MRVNREEYMRSKEWQNKRLERLRIDDFKCCKCGSPHNIQVHHTSYINLGCEDVFNDLVTLCDRCHESIEKEVRSGCVYSRPINMGSNYGIKNIIKVPIECGIIYTDLRDAEPDKQLQFKGGKIRLCKVKLSYNDLFANKEWYDEDVEEDAFCSQKGTYADYQYQLNCKEWYVLVEHDAWIHQVPVNVMRTFEIRELQNGIIEMFIVSHATWESYLPLTKTEHDTLVRLLDKCESYYRNLLMQNSEEASEKSEVITSTGITPE